MTGIFDCCPSEVDNDINFFPEFNWVFFINISTNTQNYSKLRKTCSTELNFSTIRPIHNI